MWLDADGTTVRGVEQRLTFQDSLESVERFDFSDWQYSSIDASASALLDLPRRTVVVEDFRKHFGPRAPTLPIRMGEPMPVITGVNLDSVPTTASRANVIYVFSFNACHPCGMVLDQLKAGDWKLKDGAKLVYVNPLDRVGAVAKYIDAHYGRNTFEVVIPDLPISKGLALSRYPTMVTVDAAGIVRDISESYKEDIVRDLLR